MVLLTLPDEDKLFLAGMHGIVQDLGKIKLNNPFTKTKLLTQFKLSF